MAGRVDFKIEGAAEMERLLKELGPRTASKAGAAALRAGAKPIVKEAKRLVPKDTRQLEKSITTKTERQSSGVDYRSVLIGFRQPRSRIAHLIEFGTSKMPARPFMRPALDGKAKDALDEMGRVLGERIEREARKMAKD